MTWGGIQPPAAYNISITDKARWSQHQMNRCNLDRWSDVLVFSWYIQCLLLGSQFLTTDASYMDGSVQDCSISTATTLEILQSRTKPSIYSSPKRGKAWGVYCEFKVRSMFYINHRIIVSYHIVPCYIMAPTVHIHTAYSMISGSPFPHRTHKRHPSQWETALHCNNVSHWLGASLESALPIVHPCGWDMVVCVLLAQRLINSLPLSLYHLLVHYWVLQSPHIV